MPNFGEHETIKSQVKVKLKIADRTCDSDSRGNSLLNSNSSSEDD